MSYVFLPVINVLFVGQYLLTNILKAALSDGKQAILLQTNHVQVHYLRLCLTPAIMFYSFQLKMSYLKDDQLMLDLLFLITSQKKAPVYS